MSNQPHSYRTLDEGIGQLPHYARSLLRIRVPVVVTLAGQRQPVSRIVELKPGSMIQFNKMCDEMLSLEVGNQTIAEGEAVKVGDKFGIRLMSMSMPAEKFGNIVSGRAQDSGVNTTGGESS